MWQQLNITKVYKKGISDINEDAYTINKTSRLYAVMDGATGLEGVPGHIASQAVQQEMDMQTSGYSLHARINQANQNLQEEMLTYVATAFPHDTPLDFTEIKKTNRSSTGVAAIEFNPEHTFVNFIHAGDCMIFLQYENGDIRSLTYDHIQYLDHLAIAEIVRLKKDSATKHMTFNALRESVNPLLITNRAKLNTYEGYGVIDGSDAAIEHLEYGRISLKRVKKILLISDGLQIPVTLDEPGAWEQAAKIAFDQGLEHLLQTVEAKEVADPDCLQYPRLKFQDDKTAILLEF